MTRLCANYDRDMGRLPLDGSCYMLEKCWTGRYAATSGRRLPNDPVLEASSSRKALPETRPCPVCGRAFLPDGRTRYCSPGRAKAARLKKRWAICGNTGGNVLAFDPENPLVTGAFRGRFGRGQYLFPSVPVLRK